MKDSKKPQDLIDRIEDLLQEYGKAKVELYLCHRSDAGVENAERKVLGLRNRLMGMVRAVQEEVKTVRAWLLEATEAIKKEKAAETPDPPSPSFRVGDVVVVFPIDDDPFVGTVRGRGHVHWKDTVMVSFDDHGEPRSAHFATRLVRKVEKRQGDGDE